MVFYAGQNSRKYIGARLTLDWYFLLNEKK
jgi:hypothetical protein